MAFFRNSDLEDRVRKLETAFKELSMEWNLAYEKLLQLMGRIAKRADKLEAARSNGEVPQQAPEPEPVEESHRTATGRFLTETQRQIQQRILRRRSGMGV